jgi:hypothetical protein
MSGPRLRDKANPVQPSEQFPRRVTPVKRQRTAGRATVRRGRDCGWGHGWHWIGCRDRQLYRSLQHPAQDIRWRPRMGNPAFLKKSATFHGGVRARTHASTLYLEAIRINLSQRIRQCFMRPAHLSYPRSINIGISGVRRKVAMFPSRRSRTRSANWSGNWASPSSGATEVFGVLCLDDLVLARFPASARNPCVTWRTTMLDRNAREFLGTTASGPARGGER